MTTGLFLEGGCLCGAVRYRCTAPIYPPAYCHCASCRRAAGAHAVAWFTVESASLVFTQGQPVLYRSSPPVQRTFCGCCGTPLTYRHESWPGEVDVTVGSLDEPGGVAPAAHIWMQDAPAWDRPGDGLPSHARTRRDG